MASSSSQETACKVPATRLASSKAPSKAPTATSKAPKDTPAASTGKQTTLPRSSATKTNLSLQLTPSTRKKGGGSSPPVYLTSQTKTVTPTPVLATPSEAPPDESLQVATHDCLHTPIGPPREMHQMPENKDGQQKESATDAEHSAANAKVHVEDDAPPPLQASTPPSAAEPGNERLWQAVEKGRHNSDFTGKEGVIQQLIKAEERIGELSLEVARLKKAMNPDGNPIFFRHTLWMESEMEKLKRELNRERTSTKHHLEAHRKSLIALNKLQEVMDPYGDRASLLRRNTELECQIRDMAKEEFEHRLAIAELREEVALRETRYGSCSSGSEYVTVRLASLCGLCREKLGAEADCRVARGRLAELAAAKPLGAVPPSLSGPWPPEVTRVPREPRGRAPAMPPPPQSACKMGTSEPSATPQRPGGAASMWRELTA
ncbi:uncharacterized protein Tco025E_06697, partial [Trypanosoma conorhini]